MDSSEFIKVKGLPISVIAKINSIAEAQPPISVRSNVTGISGIGGGIIGSGRPVVGVQGSNDGEDIDDDIAAGNSIFSYDNRNVRLIQDNTEFPFNYVYGPGAPYEEMYDRSVHNMINLVMNGANGAIMFFGESTSGKSANCQALAPYIFKGVFDFIGGKAKNIDFNVTVRCVELFKEEFTDLLSTKRNTSLVDVKENEMFGVYIANATSYKVKSAQDLIALFKKGMSSRTTEILDGAVPAIHRSTFIFIMELVQSPKQAPNQSPETTPKMFSRLYLFELPGAERLGDSQTSLRLKEGVNFNKSLGAFGNLVKSLSSPKDKDLANYRESKLTFLLQDVLGGNCVTICVTALSQSPQSSVDKTRVVLDISTRISRILNFPLVNEDAVLGLLRKYRTEIFQLRERLRGLKPEAKKPADGESSEPIAQATLMSHAASPDPNAISATAMAVIKNLEAQVVQLEMQKLKIAEDKERALEQLLEVREAFNASVLEKNELQELLLKAEEERLTVSKEIIDLKIENATLAEKVENAKFEADNKVLAAQNDVLELEKKLEAANAELEEANKILEKMDADKKGLATEYLALKTNYIDLNKDLALEKKKNEELSIELLNLVNAKQAVKRVKELEAEIATLKQELNELNALRLVQNGHEDQVAKQNAELMQDKAQLAQENAKLKDANAQLERDKSRLVQDNSQISREVSLLRERVADLEARLVSARQPLPSPLPPPPPPPIPAAPQPLPQPAQQGRSTPDVKDPYLKMIREFTLNEQQKLERELYQYKMKAKLAEEQLAQLQAYMDTALANYQKEIKRLKNQLRIGGINGGGSGDGSSSSSSSKSKKLVSEQEIFSTSSFVPKQ